MTPDGLTMLDASAMRLQAIGETIKNISKKHSELLNQYPGIEWNEIIKMRDLISHHYDDVDNEEVFNI